MILYPAIDIRGGHAVRLLQGDYERETAYDADPVNAAVRWADAGADFLHVVDLDGAKSGRPENLDVVKRIAATVACPIQFGGGVRSASSVAAVLRAGARRVVVGTAALRDPDALDLMLRYFHGRVVISVDARDGEVALSGWMEASTRDAAEVVADLTECGATRFTFTPIEVDGTMEGPNLSELTRVAAATDASIIYSGGIGSLSDLRTLAREAPPNVEGVIVGRALYERRFTVAEAREALA